jgi:hypothetical protein
MPDLKHIKMPFYFALIIILCIIVHFTSNNTMETIITLKPRRGSTSYSSQRRPFEDSQRSKKPIRPIENRLMIAKILQEEGMKVGAELGVQRGIYAEHNLAIWTSCEKYYLVDVWAQQENYKDLANVGNNVQNELYQETLNRLNKFGDKITVLRDFTSNAVKMIPDASLVSRYI